MAIAVLATAKKDPAKGILERVPGKGSCKMDSRKGFLQKGSYKRIHQYSLRDHQCGCKGGNRFVKGGFENLGHELTDKAKQ